MPIAVPSICKKNSSLNSKYILCRTTFNKSRIYVAIGLGMLVYKVTSNVASIASSGMGPNSMIFLMKSYVSRMYDLVLGTYFLMYSSTNLLMLNVGLFTELQMGLSGIPFFVDFWE